MCAKLKRYEYKDGNASVHGLMRLPDDGVYSVYGSCNEFNARLDLSALIPDASWLK